MPDATLDPRAIKPCPFCGAEPIITRIVEDDDFDRWFHVRCEACAIEMGDEYRSDAVDAWNRRASPQPANPAQVTDATQSPFGVLTEELDGEKAISAIEALNRAGWIITRTSAAIGAGGQAVQDTWFTDRALPVRAMSGDAEDNRVLRLHFRRPVTDDDRKAMCDALNLHQASLTHPAPSGQAVATVDDVAARLWKADAENSGTPASVAAGRTREAFDDQAEELKARWRKFAKAALSQPHPADERVVEALVERVLDVASDYMDGVYGITALRHPIDRARVKEALSAKEGR